MWLDERWLGKWSGKRSIRRWAADLRKRGQLLLSPIWVFQIRNLWKGHWGPPKCPQNHRKRSKKKRSILEHHQGVHWVIISGSRERRRHQPNPAAAPAKPDARVPRQATHPKQRSNEPDAEAAQLHQTQREGRVSALQEQGLEIIEPGHAEDQVAKTIWNISKQGVKSISTYQMNVSDAFLGFNINMTNTFVLIPFFKGHFYLKTILEMSGFVGKPPW